MNKYFIILKKFIIISNFIILYALFIIINKINQGNKYINNFKGINSFKIDRFGKGRANNKNNKCFISFINPNLRIAHFILTRFLMRFWNLNGFPEKMYSQEYILNGIRVMHNYLFPSLENQLCKDFTWILLVGNRANITYVKSHLNFNYSFKYKILYQNDFYKSLKKLNKIFDVLITTRIDYDDRIYYDAVNDVRKVINIHKPILLHGYNRGFCYYELNGEYYEFYRSKKKGVSSIFASLIILLEKVNSTYTIFNLLDHVNIRETLLSKYKSYGIKQLNYEPIVFDSGGPKYVWVRQNYSGLYNSQIPFDPKLKKIHFNLNNFYGKVKI